MFVCIYDTVQRRELVIFFSHGVQRFISVIMIKLISLVNLRFRILTHDTELIKQKKKERKKKGLNNCMGESSCFMGDTSVKMVDRKSVKQLNTAKVCRIT